MQFAMGNYMISNIFRLLRARTNGQKHSTEAWVDGAFVFRKPVYKHSRKPKYDLSLFLSARNFWDSAAQGWRLFRAPDGSWLERPVNVAMLFDTVLGATKRTSFNLYDGIGPRFSALRRSDKTTIINFEIGKVMDDAEVDAYLNHGGLIIGASGSSLSMFDTDETISSPPITDLEALPQWQIDHVKAAEHLAIVRFAMLQYGQTLFMEGDNEGSRGFVHLIVEYWMPSFAWHVDIWHQLAAGVDRFRYSDPSYQARSQEVVQMGVNILEYHGITSRPILCESV